MTILRNVNCVRFSRQCIPATICKSFSSGLKVSNVDDSVSRPKEEETFHSQKEKYISEVLANFFKLGENYDKNENCKSNNEKNGNRTFQDKIFRHKSTNKMRNYARPSTNSADKKCAKTVAADSLTCKKKAFYLNNINNRVKLDCFNEVELLSDRVDTKEKTDISEVDKEINCLLNQNTYDEAFNVFNTFWNEKKVPSYKTLRALTSMTSCNGNSSRVKLLQEAAEYYYPKEFIQDLRFCHYLCEATFREGEHSLALSMLRNFMEKYPKARRLKEIASYIMKQMTNAPEELADEAFKIACKFISFSNQQKPAYSLWYCMVQSNLYKHYYVANALLEIYPHLLDDRVDKLSQLIENAYLDDNVEFLHRLNECFLKTGKKQLIEATSSSMLALYCLSENINSANEVIKFADEEKLILSKDSIRLFMHLLHKLRLPTPFSVLAFKYGFGMPDSSQIKNRIKPTKYTFKFD